MLVAVLWELVGSIRVEQFRRMPRKWVGMDYRYLCRYDSSRKLGVCLLLLLQFEIKDSGLSVWKGHEACPQRHQDL